MLEPTLRYAGVGLRFVAWVIDLVALIALGYVIALATGNTTEEGFYLTGPLALLYFAAAFAYYIVLDAMIGATPGKLLTNLRVVKEDGARLDWSSSVVRNVFRLVDALPLLLPYLVGAILIWISEKNQRLGDRVAGTVVVRNGGGTPAAAPRDA